MWRCGSDSGVMLSCDAFGWESAMMSKGQFCVWTVPTEVPAGLTLPTDIEVKDQVFCRSTCVLRVSKVRGRGLG